MPNSSTFAFPASAQWVKKKKLSVPASVTRVEWKPQEIHSALGIHGRTAHYGGATGESSKFLFFLPFQTPDLQVLYFAHT